MGKNKGKQMNLEKQLIQKLGQLNVLNQDNIETPMALLWENQKTVLIFVRHFG
jgi:hypothetical protein